MVELFDEWLTKDLLKCFHLFRVGWFRLWFHHRWKHQLPKSFQDAHAIDQRLAVVGETPYRWPICFQVRPLRLIRLMRVLFDSVAHHNTISGRQTAQISTHNKVVNVM